MEVIFYTSTVTVDVGHVARSLCHGVSVMDISSCLSVCVHACAVEVSGPPAGSGQT